MPVSFASTKPLRRVQHEHAGAGPVEEIGPAVAVDIAHRQRVALDGAADARAAKADRVRDVLERPGHRLRHVAQRLK